MDGRAGEGTPLLLLAQFLFFALDIRATGRFAQGRIKILHVIGSELLHLHITDIGDNQILDGGEIGFVGFGCPFVLAALFGQPIHQELCYRHGGRDQECTSCQFMLDLLLAFYRLLFRGKALPFVAALSMFIFVGVPNAKGIATLRNICHTICLLIKLPGKAKRRNRLSGCGCFRPHEGHGTRWYCCTGCRRSAG